MLSNTGIAARASPALQRSSTSLLHHNDGGSSDLKKVLGKELLDFNVHQQLSSSNQNDTKCNREKRIKINVSGRIFETYKTTVISKERSIFKLKNILNYYDDEKKEYYFDRNPKAFEAILTYMQSGLLIQPEDVAYKIFIEDLQFFGFGDLALDIFKAGHGKILRNKVKQSVKRKSLQNMWGCMACLEMNFISTMLSTLSTLIIVFSIGVFCVETLPNISRERKKTLKHLETFCVVWFTIDILIRFAIAENKRRFIFHLMNIIDIISILPYYIDLIFFDKENSGLAGFAMLRALRVARVFRVFKLYRYSKSIHLLLYTLTSSGRELFLLLFFLLVLMILFSSGIYYFENNPKDPDNKFKSIPHVFWFCIVTVTTVGYGDIVPFTPAGKLLTSLLSVAGVIVIALPIPIIVNNFQLYYDKIMSNNPAYKFEFDLRKSYQVENEHSNDPLK